MLSHEDIISCAFSQWYPRFQDVAVKGVVIPAPPGFAEYIEADGVMVPKEAGHVVERHLDEWSDDDWSDTHSEPGSSSDEIELKEWSFPELTAKINETIKDYKAVFVKTTWSSPRDAAWLLTGGSLKCIRAADVYTLLKGSEYTDHDLLHAFDDSDRPETRMPLDIVLKRWYNLKPAHEFRCYISEGSIVGVTQRDAGVHYDFLHEEDTHEKIKDVIHDFFHDHVRDKMHLQRYVMDLYLGKGLDRAWIVDFNPWNESAHDPVLFTWDELHQKRNGGVEDDFELRLVPPGAMGVAHTQTRFPLEVVHAQGTTAEDLAQMMREAAEK